MDFCWSDYLGADRKLTPPTFSNFRAIGLSKRVGGRWSNDYILTDSFKKKWIHLLSWHSQLSDDTIFSGIRAIFIRFLAIFWLLNVFESKKTANISKIRRFSDSKFYKNVQKYLLMKNVSVLKMDRSKMLMSSHFVCKHAFDAIFSKLPSEFHEYSIIDRFYQFFDWIKVWLIDVLSKHDRNYNFWRCRYHHSTRPDE